jgi:GMP synthase-like glutamine amidotransferase
MPIRVLLVNCYPTDAEVKIAGYRDALRRAAERAGVAIEVREEPDATLSGAPSDLVVVSGSPKMVGEGQVEPALVELARSCAVPLLGICYGHQLLAHAFGATVRRDGLKHKGEEQVRLLKPGGLFEGFPASFPMHESHEEIVVRDEALHAIFEEIAESPEGGLEGIRHRDKPLFGVQFHPEQSGERGLQLLANFLRIGL